MKPFQITAKIISNKNIKNNYFEIVLLAPQIARNALPGQFVNIKTSEGFEPLLRRPLSIHRIGRQSRVASLESKEGKEIIMLYEVLGKGTQILSQRMQGEFLDVIGPLGNGFNCYPLSAIRYPPILIAGGMGTAPLVFLAERLVHSPQSIVHRKPLVLIGARSESHILCEKEFKELGCEVKIATDDGSRGFKGYVSSLLTEILSTVNCQPSTIYACGPKLLLKEISRISLEQNIPAQLSLESHMACGIGACMGCVIKVKSKKAKGKIDDEYKRVCKEGPVFEAREIAWE
ncbi:MAG: dihydroorotate dehydrogenase electron transfer subunit [Candidatus Omnitrophota bacterium]